MIRALASLFMLSLLPSLGNAGIVPGPTNNPANGHSYYLLSDQSWDDAEAEALTLGGHLVTVNDAAENQWLVDTFGPSGTGFLGIGYNDAAAVEGTFAWSSGQTPAYTNWAAGEPSNSGSGEDHVVLLTRLLPNIGQWNDGRGTAFGVAEVVIAAVPEPSSALLFLKLHFRISQISS
jgi:hypothetical protein